ncbi:MAG: HIT domain-containing protein [Nitrososphaerota archaeon]
MSGESIERLWSPWRMAYIKRAFESRSCIFCDKPKAGRDRENLILARGRYCFVMLNAYPYNSGHLMIAPYRHIGQPSLLREVEFVDLFRLLRVFLNALDKAYTPSGYNIGMNVGRPSGAGIPGHVHLHVVPRWTGDTNFMTVISGTKVMPETLDQSYDKILSVLPDDIKSRLINKW